MTFFDLRRPLGWLFGIIGLLLLLAGLRVTPSAEARSLGININLIWGAVMIAFSLICLWLARREARRRENSTMKTKQLIVLLFLILLPWRNALPAASPSPTPVRKAVLPAPGPAPDGVELTKLLQDFLEGASRNDAAIHERFWAPDLIYTSSSGRRIGKADIMREVREEGPPKPGDETTVFTAEDIRIQQYGTTAVIAFRLVGTTQKGDKTEVANYLNTGTLLKRDGQWQTVAWQATVLPADSTKKK